MTKYQVDLAHSTIGFTVKHMMISKVKGTFENFTANVEATDLTDLTTAKIDFSIQTASINTRNEDRDNHLRSGDFFDADTFKNITFAATKIEADGDDEYKVTGDLTIRDITKPVTFEVEYNGKSKSPAGQEVFGFEAETKINREDFGLTWNAALETGGVLVGKDIKINVELEIIGE